MPRRIVCAAVLLSLMGSGCANLDLPYVAHPGSVNYQRARAHRWDPFPDSEAGPAIPETRPREYQDAPPEPSRARWVRPSSTAVQF
jgi:hypothetical protein